MAQLTGEVAYLHQACALCFAMRDNLAAAVVSTLLCKPMLHAREGGSRLSPKIACCCAVPALRLELFPVCAKQHLCGRNVCSTPPVCVVSWPQDVLTASTYVVLQV